MTKVYITESGYKLNVASTLRMTASEAETLLDGVFEPALGNPDANGYVLSSTAAGVRSWVEGGGGASDVDDLATSTGSSTNMLRVAAAGGLEYRTTAQVLSDINAAPTASPTFTGTVTLPTTVASVIKPASDSTTALQLANAAGTAVVTVDTTNTNVVFAGEFYVKNNDAKWSLRNASGTAYFTARHDGVTLVETLSTGNWQIYVPSGKSYQVNVNSVGYLRVTEAKVAVGHGTTPTAAADLAASTTAAASLRIRSGTAPTTPNDGDIWNDGTDFNLYGGGLKLHTGVIKPASDSTTALQLTNAAGTAVLTVDTTGGGATVTGATVGYLRVDSPTSVASVRTLRASGKFSEFGSGLSNAYFGFDNSGYFAFATITGFGAAGYSEKVTISATGIFNFKGTMGNSTKTVGTDAPADWVEVQIGGTTYYLPAYAA